MFKSPLKHNTPHFVDLEKETWYPLSLYLGKDPLSGHKARDIKVFKAVFFTLRPLFVPQDKRIFACLAVQLVACKLSTWKLCKELKWTCKFFCLLVCFNYYFSIWQWFKQLLQNLIEHCDYCVQDVVIRFLFLKKKIKNNFA